MNALLSTGAREHWRAFISGAQCATLSPADKLALAKRIATIPPTYAQDGLGGKAVAFLRYALPPLGGEHAHGSAGSFVPCWYITERDVSADDEHGQAQCFGWAELHPGDGELGYISIPEILSLGGKLDLTFTPCQLDKLTNNFPRA